MPIDPLLNPNRYLYDQLLSHAIITQDEYERALAVEPDWQLARPAAALVRMLQTNVITAERFDEIVLSYDERDAAGRPIGVQHSSPLRDAILEEAEDLEDTLRGNALQAAAPVKSQPLFRGPRWLWNTVFVAAAGGIGWLVFGPAAAPSCTDPKITRTLQTMFLTAGIDQAVANPLLSMDKPPASAVIGKVSEVGYLAQQRVRGCVAAVRLGETEHPYAFTIGRTADSGRKFVVTGANLPIVQARFGNLDKDGQPVHDAAPIGRTELERAVRAGAAAQRERLAVTAPHVYQSHIDQSQQKLLSSQSAARLQEIAEVEPTAPCRALKPGTAYSCRLLVEYVMPGTGLSPTPTATILDSDFTFERDNAAAPWRVSAAFDKEFDDAFVAAVVKRIGERQRARRAP